MLKLTIIIFIIYIITGQNDQDLYERIISEKVSEEYCQNVITNITALIEEGYVYSDFLKAPKQPEGYINYTTKVDLISEFNKIEKKNRTFYDFYRDINSVTKKTNDRHLDFLALFSPNESNLFVSRFCIPFDYSVVTINNSNHIEAYMTIVLRDVCKENYTSDILKRIKDLSEKKKKIIEINKMNPYEYFDKFYPKGIRSTQAKYISLLKIISDIPIYSYPLKKEELQISIKFEGEDDLLNLEYQFYEEDFSQSSLLNNLGNLERGKMRLLNDMNQVHLMEKNMNRMKEKKENIVNRGIIWDLTNQDESLKCKIDDENELNVIYQNSFNTFYMEDYENIMYECFSRFYSNNYKIIVIEDSNTGGFTELCIPFQQYIFPKVLKPQVWNMKSSELNKNLFFINDENLNIDTCKTYTEEDNILEGEEDIYDNGIFHKKTKKVEKMNIFEKKIMEKKRREYLSTGLTKKPTEILIFTDGNSFSCASIVIKGLQTNGVGIMVGYNSRPDLIGKKFEASISNSGFESYDSSKYRQNLRDLGFIPSITFSESFDQNDKNNPKIPMEFLVYPIDENVNIFSKYDDSLYEQFIQEAKKIFEKYNDLENGQCNPDNKYLYYETKECDNKINIEHAHGGYICGSNGKWDKNNCLASYCDVGYILNDERTKCVEDPCEKFKLNEIFFKDENKTEFIIEPNNVYIFKNFSKNTSLYIHTDFDKPLFYKYNYEHILEQIDYSNPINENDIIYANYFMNISNIVKININKNKPNKKDNNHNEDDNINNDTLPVYAIILIILGSIIFLLALIFIIRMIIKKKRNNSIMDRLDKIEPLNNI